MITPNWKYDTPAATDYGDHRKLVTLDIRGMVTVTVRGWTGTSWVNAVNDESVIAWDDLPAGFFDNGLPPGIPPAGGRSN